MATPFSVGDLYNLARTAYEQQFYGDESGNVRQPFMSQEQFNALPERQRFDMAGQYTTGGTNVYRDENENLVGYGDPRFIEAGAERWTGDPSQIQRNSEGRFSIDAGNVNQDALNDIQNATDRSGYFSGTSLQNILRGFGTVLGAAGAANAMGLGEAGMATDIAPGYLSEGVAPQVSQIAPEFLTESIAPQVTEVMAGSPWDIPVGPMLEESIAPQVTEQMAGNPYFTPSISVDPMLEESVAPQVTEPMSGSPFSESWLDKLPDLARDLLGGGQQGAGGNPIIAALMGATGKFGDHKQDNDPYGLQASGYGPWKGLIDDPKAKVVDAMMKRKQDSIWS